jgi:hypothetical protein
MITSQRQALKKEYLNKKTGLKQDLATAKKHEDKTILLVCIVSPISVCSVIILAYLLIGLINPSMMPLLFTTSIQPFGIFVLILIFCIFILSVLS